MAQAAKQSNNFSILEWVTVGLLFVFAFSPSAFALPVTYTYDDLNRLSSVDYDNGQQVITYSYDAAGNILCKSIAVTGQPRDSDCDDVFDAQDAFPFDPNESVDTDKDGIGNNADTDDDNDGMPDSFETAIGLDPLISADASGDLDGDGFTNLQEFNSGTDLNDPASNAATAILPVLQLLLAD